MTPEQKAVLLDAAQETQVNETWWEQFEWLQNGLKWTPCTIVFNPLCVHAPYYVFRRKPRTITVTMPVPRFLPIPMGINWSLNTEFATEADRDTALAAIREAMK